MTVLTPVSGIEKLYSVIEFNQKAWLMPYADMDAKMVTRGQTRFPEKLLQPNKQFRVW